MDLDRKQAIGLMLASFPASQSQGQLVALAYLMAVDGFSDYAVISSAQQFIRGEVKDHDKRFAPSAAQFADHVAKSEIPAQVVDYAARHPEALAAPTLDTRYKAEMQRRISDIAANMRIGNGLPKLSIEEAAMWSKRMEVWNLDRTWGAWGPMPGERGCRVPSQFLAGDSDGDRDVA